MPAKLQDLMKRLLTKEPNKRLGHVAAKDIKDHPWFEKLNWDALLHRNIKPPFMPKLSSDLTSLISIVSLPAVRLSPAMKSRQVLRIMTSSRTSPINDHYSLKRTLTLSQSYLSDPKGK